MPRGEGGEQVDHAHSMWQGTAFIIAILQQIQLYHFLISLTLIFFFEFNFLQNHLLIFFILSLSVTVTPDNQSVCLCFSGIFNCNLGLHTKYSHKNEI